MPATMRLLRRDHANFTLMLSVLERQSHITDSGKTPSLELIKLVLLYLRDYPRKVHHPKEDLIYGALALHMRGDAEAVFNVIQEHRALAERLEPLEQAVAAFDAGCPASVAIFRLQELRFIEKQRQHMALEEALLYPAAIQRLTAEEWARIDGFMANEQDPLFGDEVSAPYEKLREAILDLDERLRPLQ